MKTHLKLLWVALFAGLGMAAGYLAGGSIKHFPEFKDRISELTWIDGCLIPVGFLLVLAVHELGHLAGGKLCGMQFLLFVVGPFQFSQSASGVRLHLVWKLGSFGGLVVMLPDAERPIRPQLIRMISGGPVASLILSAAGFILYATTTGAAGFHGISIGFMSSMIFLVTAVPSKAGGFMSDGMQLIEVLRGDKAVLFRQQFMSLYAQSLAGVRPRDWDQQLLSSVLLESATMDGLRQTSARYLALLAAIDRGESARSDEHAAWIAEHFTDYPMGMRQGLTLELCLYALQNGDLKSAREWYSKSSGGILDRSRRSLATAWLAFAEGDHSDAKQKILHARRELRHSMDRGVAVMSKERLDLLEQEIAGA